MQEEKKLENREIKGVTLALLVTLLIAVAVASWTVAIKYAEATNEIANLKKEVINLKTVIEKYHSND